MGKSGKRTRCRSGGTDRPEKERWPQAPQVVASTRGGAFEATQAEYEGWGGPRNHYHQLDELGIHVVRRP